MRKLLCSFMHAAHSMIASTLNKALNIKPMKRGVQAIVGVCLTTIMLTGVPHAWAGVPRHEFAVWISPTSAVNIDTTDLRQNAAYFSSAQALLFKATCQSVRPYSSHIPSIDAIVSSIHTAGLPLFFTIQGSDSAGHFIDCWNNPFTLDHHVHELVALAQKYHAEGIDIDYEQPYFDSTPQQFAALRQGYNNFMSRLCEILHSLHKQCAIAVVPTKTGHMLRGGTHAPFIFDYSTLGIICDRVEIMAYDQHQRNGPAGPIAGLPWMNDIARYVSTTIAAHKVWFGMPLYGRDWVGNHAVTVKNPTVQALAARPDVHPVFDPVQGEITFTYDFGRHTVWYSNYTSLKAKLALVRRYGFHPAFWSLGQEVPGTWASL